MKIYFVEHEEENRSFYYASYSEADKHYEDILDDYDGDSDFVSLWEGELPFKVGDNLTAEMVIFLLTGAAYPIKKLK
jgi:hypothetical protein